MSSHNQWENIRNQLDALGEWIKSYRCKCEIDPTTGFRAEQIPCERCMSLASLGEDIAEFEVLRGDFDDMFKAITDIYRYFANKPFPSDGERLTMYRCKTLIDRINS